MFSTTIIHIHSTFKFKYIQHGPMKEGRLLIIIRSYLQVKQHRVCDGWPPDSSHYLSLTSSWAMKTGLCEV